MKPKNVTEIQKAFTAYAPNYEKGGNTTVSKGEYLDYTIKYITTNLKPEYRLLDAAAGACWWGRSFSPFVKSVVFLDATPVMLDIGKKEAMKSGITNVEFINGYVDEIPFEEQHFDVVFTSCSFHHFTEMERPFSEMSRVLKSGGLLVILDIEAAEENLREIEDKIETMRDPSHVKNRSQNEFSSLYKKHGYTFIKQESPVIPVVLSDWLALTNTPDDVRKEIEDMMKNEMQNGNPTGFRPYLQDEKIYFEQKWVLFVGKKRKVTNKRIL